ncbi:MAG: long-chain-fatty-acid--CoA ligase [Frankiales bacterium]|nr:long-chain-fatty-acid--CoA ligase [Frankiales bacterium]
MTTAAPTRARTHHALHPDGTTVLSVADILRRRAVATPHRVAMLDATSKTTFAELDARSSQVAQALLQDGVVAGDRVAYVGSNAPSLLEVVNGAARVGAIAVPVNNRLAPGEVAVIVEDAGACVVVLGAEDASLHSVLSELSDVRQVVVVGGADDATDYQTWLGAQQARDPGHVSDPQEPALLFYSSGTTGRPKGVVLNGDNVGSALGAARDQVVFTETSVAMAPIPFFHIAGFGLALQAVLNGSVLLLELPTGVAGLIDLLVRRRVTHAVMVPTVLQAVVNDPAAAQADWSALEYVVYGASPIPLPVIRAATEVLACRFLQSYGLTETTGGVTLLSPEDHTPDEKHARRLTSAGRALPGVELRIVDPVLLEDVPAGEHGEVLVSSGHVMAGYWRRDEETARALLPGGWLRTGDGGSLDEDGYLYLHDRLKDMIITGGENVFPAEVESVLTGHPAIAEVAVVGVPSETWGESAYAVVVLRPGQALSEGELVSWSRERMAHFKCPVGMRTVDALPRNASGKLLKAKLRAELATS